MRKYIVVPMFVFALLNGACQNLYAQSPSTNQDLTVEETNYAEEETEVVQNDEGYGKEDSEYYGSENEMLNEVNLNTTDDELVNEETLSETDEEGDGVMLSDGDQKQ